jgi:hypothetical protein
MPLSIFSPFKIHSRAVLNYSSDIQMEISDMPAANMKTGCVEIQSKFSQEAESFKYDTIYARTGGTFMKAQLEQCQSDIAEEFKKSMPSFLIKKVEETK